VSVEYRTVQLRTNGCIPGGAVETAALHAELTRFGKDGWELVSAVDAPMDRGANRYIVLFLRRRLRSAAR
jgi:hypothetical protein